MRTDGETHLPFSAAMIVENPKQLQCLLGGFP